MSRIRHAGERRIAAAPAYCTCEFPNSHTINTHHGAIADLVSCQCGETPATQQCEWHWHTAANTPQIAEDNAALIANNGKDVTFHPSYSHGTAIVRGDKPLAHGHLHYWEIRIITVLSGTDVMFGIGTDQLDLNAFQFHFVSALGTNTQSWGYSYQGRIQHNGQQQHYGQPFSQGAIVGVLLDLMHGKLEFYLNRRSLGIAYTNIPLTAHTKIYPMVCSTAARSCVRLISACSAVLDLQCRCFAALLCQKQMPLQLPPGLNALLSKYWFLTLTATRADIDNSDTVPDSANRCQRNANANNNHDIQSRIELSSCSTKRDKQCADKPLATFGARSNAVERVMRPAALSASQVRSTRKPKLKQTRKRDNANEGVAADDDKECDLAVKLPTPSFHVSTELVYDAQSAYHGYFHYML